jgi:hypothetical protein
MDIIERVSKSSFFWAAIILVVIFILALLFNSSFSKSFCPVHNVVMKKQKVRLLGGDPDDISMIYESEIKNVYFPYCDDPVFGSGRLERREYTKLYVCERCNIDRDEWNKRKYEEWKKTLKDENGHN